MNRQQWFLLFSVLFFFCSSAQAQMSPAQAFQEGRNFGQSGISGAAGSVTDARGAEVVPNYNTNAPESRHFQGGRGILTNATTEKLIECRDSSIVRDAYQQQECDAINYLLSTIADREPGQTRQPDEITAASQPIISNPGTVPAEGTGVFCRTVVQGNPGEYVTETCTTVKQTAFESCVATLEIEVEWVEDEETGERTPQIVEKWVGCDDLEARSALDQKWSQKFGQSVRCILFLMNGLQTA